MISMGLFSVVLSILLGLSHPQTAPATEMIWKQVWPCEANGRRMFNRQPSTGPGAYTHFRWAGMGTWKRYKVRKGVPIIIRANGDSCRGCCLGDIAFRLSEFVNGKKAERFVFRGPKWRGEKPPGEPGYRLVYYVPRSEKFEIACTGSGFYVTVYQLAEIQRKDIPLTDKDRAKVAELIKKMDDDSWQIREQAHHELEQMGKKILPLLRPVLEKDKDKYSFEVRLRIETLIKMLDPPKTNIISDRDMKKQAADLVEKLSAHIAANNYPYNSEQAKSLASIGPYAVKPLKKHCLNKSRHIRIAAVCALGKLGDADSVKTIISLLKTDKDVEVRCRAAAALAAFDTEEVVKALKDASENDPSDRVPKQAIESLNQLLKNRKQKPITAPVSP